MPNPLAVLVVLLAVARPASAAEEQPLRAVDFVEVPLLSEPQLSPNGRQVLYVRSEVSWKANKRISHVHRIDADGTGTRQMTSGTEGESSPRWAPDGKSFVFLAQRPGAEGTQIYEMSNDGGEARRLTRHPTSISNVQWARDGSGLFFLAPEPKTAAEKAR